MRLPKWAVPLCIVVLSLAGLWGADLFSLPSLAVEFPQTSPKSLDQLVKTNLIVGGVRCVDTASKAISVFEGVGGIYRIRAFASYHRLEIQYDPTEIGKKDMIELLQGPVYDRESNEFSFNLYKVLEVDNRKLTQ
jgi:hypothetical protein